MKNFILALIVFVCFSSYASACHRGKRVFRPMQPVTFVAPQQVYTVPVQGTCVNGVCR